MEITVPDDRAFEILLVQDNPGDIRLTQEALKDAGVPHNLTVAEDGKKALAVLRREGDYSASARPDTILLDLGLPEVDARQVLAQIKSDPDLKRVPVVVLTVSDSQADILRSYELQVSNYLTKPIDPDHFKVIMQATGEYMRAVARVLDT